MPCQDWIRGCCWLVAIEAEAEAEAEAGGSTHAPKVVLAKPEWGKEKNTLSGFLLFDFPELLFPPCLHEQDFYHTIFFSSATQFCIYYFLWMYRIKIRRIYSTTCIFLLYGI